MNKRGGIDRVATRPDPAMWGNHELMNLSEAARLMWPNGPLTERSLRTAIREGRLPISVVAGKFFVTKEALAALSVCKPAIIGTAASPGDPVKSLNDVTQMDLDIIQKMRSA